ncbi:MAG TPA: pantoate--beta-alanine ligase [Woeseiaceae bacterium]|nr:pantoate--beta-alanine ligase [Woeseiaceae bacterium]
MEVIRTREELRDMLANWRHHDEHVALVPTMGNLHQGHVSLVDLARQHAERVVVSVYVNPTQFGPGEDFTEYPRTLERDTRRLRKVRADVLFVPDDETVYPFGHECATVVAVPGLTENFCGAFRPKHFDGVTSVVARLFALVTPDVAVFGQKDYQQQLVVRYMTEDLNLPIRIITAPTVREDDGLAMSSRNAYLSDEERPIAPRLYSVLSSVAGELQDGKRDFAALEKQGRSELEAAGFTVEYLAVRRAQNLAEPDRDCDELVVLAAVRLGKARLIDNVVVTV